MKQLCTLGLLAIAACQTQQAGERMGYEQQPSAAGREINTTLQMPQMSGRSQQQNQPYSGYPGPVGPTDAGAADAGTTATPADAGALSAPPSTAMPGARPLYPDAGADGGARM